MTLNNDTPKFSAFDMEGWQHANQFFSSENIHTFMALLFTMFWLIAFLPGSLIRHTVKPVTRDTYMSKLGCLNCIFCEPKYTLNIEMYL